MQFGYTVEMTGYGYGGASYSATENQGKKIRDRINALGQNGDQWLETYGGVSKKKAEEEAARRNRKE
jgi:hypothetical protein